MHPAAHHEPGQYRRLDSGYIFLEVATTYIIAAYVIVALMTVFSLAAKSNPASEKSLVAATLAAELMEEVKVRKWDETQPASRPGYPSYSQSTLGVDTGESASNKTTFDDVDDFSGWLEKPPQDPTGVSMSNWSKFTRTVTITYVTSALVNSGTPTDYKKVTVCAYQTTFTSVCMDWIAGRL